jgi:uncharacterized membrane protein
MPGELSDAERELAFALGARLADVAATGGQAGSSRVMKGWQFLCLVLVGSLFAITGLRQFFVEPLAGSHEQRAVVRCRCCRCCSCCPRCCAAHSRGYFYAILAASLYFIHGTMEAATADQRALALWETGFAVALIATASLAMRRLNRDGGSGG